MEKPLPPQASIVGAILNLNGKEKEMSKVIVPRYISEGGIVLRDDSSDPLAMRLKALAKKKAKLIQSGAITLSAAADAGQDKPDQLTAVNDHLVSSSGLTPDQTDMFSKTLLWIQHVVLGHVKNDLNWDDKKIANPEVRNSQDWWDANSEVIQSWVPWTTIDLAVNSKQDNVTKSGDVNMTDAIHDVMQLVAGEEAAAQVLALAKTLNQGADTGTPVDSVGHLFWNSKSASDSKSELSTSPAISCGDDISYAYAFIFMSETKKDWRSLFVSHHYESFTYRVVSLRIQIHKSMWDETKDEINAKLLGKAKDEIKHAPFD